MEKIDIKNRKDIEQVLTSFYEKAIGDQKIGRFFTEVVRLNLETHLPLIADFWESVIFGTGNYRKNVMAVHEHIHELAQIRNEHLDRWVQLFTTTVNEQFAGTKATLMKQRAASIATLMDIKLNHKSINRL